MGSHRPELALNMIVGSSSCSPDSVSPDVANATTPALVVASFSAVLRAVSDGLHRIGVSAMSRTPLPNKGVHDIPDAFSPWFQFPGSQLRPCRGRQENQTLTIDN